MPNHRIQNLYPHQYDFEELVLEQMEDTFCLKIHSSLDAGEVLCFGENPDTGVFERVPPYHFATVIPALL